MFIKLQHEASLNNAAHGRYLVFFGIPSITQRARGAEGQRGRGVEGNGGTSLNQWDYRFVYYNSTWCGRRVVYIILFTNVHNSKQFGHLITLTLN